MIPRARFTSAAAAVALALRAGVAAADDDVPAPRRDVTAAQLTLGASLQGGNTRQVFGTVSGAVERRFGDNQLRAQTIANFGRGAAGGEAPRELARNVWSRARYERFLGDRFATFLLLQHRYDRYQGLDFRGNLDPGVKYLVFDGDALEAWVEAGYDLQHDVRRPSDTVVYLDADTPKLLPSGDVERLPRTYTDHSSRLSAGGRYAFNKTVSVALGVEYLQSFREDDRYRINVDSLLAANLFGGVSAGVAFVARYDNAPLPGKRELDTAMMGNLVLALDSRSSAPKPSCPATPPCPTCPPPAGPGSR